MVSQKRCPQDYSNNISGFKQTRRNILYLKGGLHSSVWSTKTFLYNIRKLRYKQNSMGYEISMIWNNYQSIFFHLEIWYYCDLFIIFLAWTILEGWDKSYFKCDFLWHCSSSNPFLYKLLYLSQQSSMFEAGYNFQTILRTFSLGHPVRFNLNITTKKKQW